VGVADWTNTRIVIDGHGVWSTEILDQVQHDVRKRRSPIEVVETIEPPRKKAS
jgi:hypothetical protein